MNWSILPARVRALPPTRQIPLILVAGTLFGALILPALIYAAGVTVLGRIENGSLAHQYGSIFHGLASGRISAWIVILGPGVLILLFQGLRWWWRRGVEDDG